MVPGAKQAVGYEREPSTQPVQDPVSREASMSEKEGTC